MSTYLEDQKNLILGLRQLADFLEAHPQPCYLGFSTINVFPKSKEQFLECVRGVGGVKKDVKGEWFCAVKEFPGGITMEWNQKREAVCERVVMGKRRVERPVYKQTGTEMVDEEIVEWRCPESILRPSAVQEATAVGITE